MKKFICFPILAAIFSMCIWNDFCFLDTLKSLNIGRYSVFCDENISLDNFDNLTLSGGVKIYSFGQEKISKKLGQKSALCEQVFVSKNEGKNYIKNNNLLYIKSEQIEGVKITYYLCKKLPKMSAAFGQKFNIVIAERKSDFVIGYPAIMGSL